MIERSSESNDCDKPMVEISVVVPVYKEEESIRPFLERIEKTLEKLLVTYEIIFALDPSPDRTEIVICEEIERNPNIKLLVFSRRFGQPPAIMGGIRASCGRYVVLIDVDLQDPPELIGEMYKVATGGVDVVYARRIKRHGETLIKKMVSKIGSYLIKRLSDVPIPNDVGEFRIMSRRVVDELLSLKESHGFIRGLISYVGFNQQAIDFIRDARHFEEGKYNRFTGSIKLGLNGLISFSSKPIQVVSIIGFILSGLSFFLGMIFFTMKVFGFPFVPGQAAIILVVSFFSGVQMISLGVMGEYVGRIYDEIKGRPLYIVDKWVNFGDEK